ncbi:MAG: hypothetical protein Q4C56_04015 [Peptococcaceae bacterium]|nr:hypothetical protein [Peptococcaceae bacterium]
MATKLKKMRLTSVDLVRRGANQKADICLYKSADHVRKDEDTMLKIDKSRFTDEELATYQALIQKALVNPEDNEEALEKDKPPLEDAPRKKPLPEFLRRRDDAEEDAEDEEEARLAAEKTAENDATIATLKAAIAEQERRTEALTKSLAMKEFTEIAKRYAPLGEKEEVLAKNLYAMHNADPALYDQYVSALDKSLALMEKTGLFAEIGKSGASAPQSAIGRVEAIAKGYMQADPSLSRAQAVAKAWEDNPELIRDYEAQYNA